MRGETFIYFDGQYWVGIFSEETDGKIVRVGRYIFGPEPSMAFLDEWTKNGMPGLIMRNIQDNCQTIPTFEIKKKNPKRMIREVRKEILELKKGKVRETKAQKAIRDSFEQFKKESKKQKTAKKKEIAKIRYIQKQSKKKDKKRGH